MISIFSNVILRISNDSYKSKFVILFFRFQFHSWHSFQSRQLDIHSTIKQLTDIQRNLDEILHNCRTLPLPYEQIHSALEKIEELNMRIDQLQMQLSPPPPPPPPSSSSAMKISSPTSTRILDPSSVTTSNGFHQSSTRQVKKRKSYANRSFVLNFVLIDENKCPVFLFLYQSIHLWNVFAFFSSSSSSSREPTVIFLRLQFSLITIQFVHLSPVHYSIMSTLPFLTRTREKKRVYARNVSVALKISSLSRWPPWSCKHSISNALIILK